MSQRSATPLSTQCSGGLNDGNHRGVIKVKSVLLGFLYTGH